MQTDLQLLLLIIGLVFGGFILYNTFRNKTRKKSSRFDEFEAPSKNVVQHAERHDPLLDDYKENTVPAGAPLESDFLASAVVAFDIEPLPQEQPKPIIKAEPILEKTNHKKLQPQTVKPEIIALSIMPKQQNSFMGAMLLSALKANQFYYGEHKIFHRHVDDNPKEEILFSIASLVEPGNFEYHQMFNKTFPGILIWMMLPVPQDAMQSFDKMLRSARQLATFLSGELCDTKRLTLTTEAIATMRERVHQFQVRYEQHVEYELEDAE